MKKEYEVLYTPMKIGNVEIKNRFVLCPMEGDALIGALTGKGFLKENIPFYINQAKGNVGLFIAGALPAYNTVGHSWIYKKPAMFKPIKEVMDECHKYDMKVFFQLTAGLGRNFPYLDMFRKAPKLFNAIMKLEDVMAAPDEGLPTVWATDIKTKQLAKEDIKEIIYALAETAYLCKENGVDGIEIHALHEGYLLDQFSTPYTNHRTDEYGGSLENRLRFACEIVKAIKARCGEDYPVILRYSVTSKVKGFNEGIIPQDNISTEIGRTLEESEKAIKILEEAGYDAFDCDNGTYDSWYHAHPPVYMPLNCNLETSKHIKKFTTKPIISAGRQQLDETSEAISNGEIDFMGLARQLLCDSEYINKVKEDRLDEVRPCISCHLGCLPLGIWKGVGAQHLPTTYCALNPAARQEGKYEVVTAKSPKNIAVIGGGIAGMEFAIQATLRGHEVEIYEKSNRLGGVFNEAATFSFKEKDRDLIQYYIKRINDLDITVHFNTEIKSLSDVNADEVVIATGALSSRKLNVLGSENAVAAIDFLKGDMETGEDVAIIGGGLTGAEIAYELLLKGKRPFIVEMQDDILKVKGSSMANTSFLRDAFKFYHMNIYLSSSVKEIGKDSITIVKEDGTEEVLKADLVISSIGYNKGIPFDVKKSKHVHIIGDADNVSTLMNAVWQANDLAVKLSK